jgi:hypothetical protein
MATDAPRQEGAGARGERARRAPRQGSSPGSGQGRGDTPRQGRATAGAGGRAGRALAVHHGRRGRAAPWPGQGRAEPGGGALSREGARRAGAGALRRERGRAASGASALGPGCARCQGRGTRPRAGGGPPWPASAREREGAWPSQVRRRGAGGRRRRGAQHGRSDGGR